MLKNQLYQFSIVVKSLLDIYKEDNQVDPDNAALKRAISSGPFFSLKTCE